MTTRDLVFCFSPFQLHGSKLVVTTVETRPHRQDFVRPQGVVDKTNHCPGDNGGCSPRGISWLVRRRTVERSRPIMTGILSSLPNML